MTKLLKPVAMWLVLLTIFILCVVFMRDARPFRIIETGSMTPTLPIHSIVFTKKKEVYKPGDMITFVADGGEVKTHRLIGTDPSGTFITKGDANLSADNWSDPVTIKDVKGKVIYTFLFTSPDVLRTPIGMAFIGLLLLFVALLWPERKDKKGKG